MSNYSGTNSQYINGTFSSIDTYKKYEKITNILADTKENEKLYRDKYLKADRISSRMLKLEKLIL